MSKHPSTPDHDAIAAAAARWVSRRDAGCTAAEEAEFQQWLAQDERHAAALRHYTKTWSQLDRPRTAGSAAAVIHALASRQRRRRQRRGFAAVICAGVMVLLLSRHELRWNEAQQPAHAARGVVLEPERRVLPDGSVVELPADTDLTVAYEERVRRVVLHRGHAHFDVVKDSDRPFVVVAGGLDVRAVGTSFMVDVGRVVEVLVTGGRVAVEKSAPGSEDQPAELKGTAASPLSPAQTFGFLEAGDRLVLDLERSTEHVQPQRMDTAEMSERLGWRSRRLNFSATPLSEAVELMNQHAANTPAARRVRLVVDPASGLADEPVSGIFRAGNTEAFVRVLEVSLGLHVDRRDDQITLRRSR